MSVLLTAVLCLSAVQAEQEPREPAAQETQRPAPLPIPRAGVLRRGSRRIVVDGSLQDWPALPPIGLDDVRQVSGTSFGAFRSLDDLAGKVFLVWDEDDLYVAAQVMDDWHVKLAKDSPRNNEIPPADSILLTFDPLRDTRAMGFDPGRGEDAEFWLAEVDGQEGRIVRWDRFRGVARFAEGGGGKVAHDAERRITTYEARIPWREILPAGRKAEPGAILDMQVVLSDHDEPTDPIPQTRIGWNFGMGPRIDPGLFGSILLLDVEAGDPVVAKLGIPELPPAADGPELPFPDEAYWIGLKARIDRTKPTIVDPDTPDVAFAGGKERHDVLAELEQRLAEQPRVDFLEFQARIHRRMNRECAGLAMTGLPYFWDHVLEGLVRRVGAEADRSGIRVFRLPQGGHLVQSPQATFAVDPAGYRIDHALFDEIDFVLCTRPLQVTERQDQLAARMAAARPPKPVFTHVAVHLPGMDVREIPIVASGQAYDSHGLIIRPLVAQDAEGLVTQSCGYHVRWPDGTDLVISGTDMLEEFVRTEDRIELLLLSVRHPRARIVGQRLDADVTLLDDALECAVAAGPTGRTTLAQLYELQNGILPRRSVFLAPGEQFELSR
jgi:hypothetical protein